MNFKDGTVNQTHALIIKDYRKKENNMTHVIKRQIDRTGMTQQRLADMAQQRATCQ